MTPLAVELPLKREFLTLCRRNGIHLVLHCLDGSGMTFSATEEASVKRGSHGP